MTNLEREKAINLFADQHYSCNMIAKALGYSRAGIKKFLNHAGYDTSKSIARNMTIECLNCGKKVTKPTCIGRKTKYCSSGCYYEFMKDGEYKPYRQGQRIGRAMLQPYISRYFGKNQKFVVHHKDGDDHNNNFNNLIAFYSQSDHLAYHRKHRIVSALIDGSNIFI
jgi:hypothetical protein